ncbi:MAG: hypothetical protein K0S28_1258 [Paucimonas sp.]|jgi:hypothetical protein|nr:hypothetical protein [Paucimonas sp.]
MSSQNVALDLGLASIYFYATTARFSAGFAKSSYCFASAMSRRLRGFTAWLRHDR